MPAILQRHRGPPLTSDPQQPSPSVALSVVRGLQWLSILSLASMRGQRVSVPHLPETALCIYQGDAEIREAISLIARRLSNVPNVPIDICEIVPINRSCPSRDGTRRSMGVVMVIDSHAVLWRQVQRHHVKQIELRIHVKEIIRARLISLQMLDIGNDFHGQ